MIERKKHTSNAFPNLDRKLEFQPVVTANPKTLSKEQIGHFNEVGYLSKIPVYKKEGVDAIRIYFDSLMQEAYSLGHNSYSINGWHSHQRRLYDIVMDSCLSDVLVDLLGENLICWGTHFFCKEPFSTEQVSWHQDISYWPMSASKTVTVWLAIDDVCEENAAMKVIPGSHLHGQIDFVKSQEKENNVLHQTISKPEEFGSSPVSIDLKAGQIELHSDLLIHGSKANTSNRRRAGLTMRFLSPEVIPYNGWGGNALLTRGKCTYDHWNIIDRPLEETIPVI